MEQNTPLFVLYEILDRIRRWWWTVVAGVAVGLAGGLIFYSVLPKTYEASTLILVSAPQIPEEYVRSPINDSMGIRLRSLKEAVLSRPYLEKLIAAVHGEGLPEERVDSLMRRIRRNLQARVTDVNERRGTGMFELIYEDEDPELAAQLANELAQLFIAENVRLRQGQAETLVLTLQDLVSEVRGELQIKERQISSFKARHLHALPDHRQANLQLLATRRADLEAAERSISSAQDRLNLLRAQKRENEVLAVPDRESATGGLTSRIAAARQQLETLRERYTDQHPEVLAAESRLNRLLGEAERAGLSVEGGGAGGPEGSSDTGLTPFQVRERAIQNEIAHMQAKADRIRGEIDRYQNRVERTPAVEQELAELTKGYSTLEKRHADLQGKLEEAKGSLRVEQAHKGQQFEIMQLAEAPSRPASPNKQAILTGAVCIGLAVFVGPLVIRALLRPVIASRSTVESLSTVPVLLAIPEISTKDVVTRKRRAFLVNVTSSAASVAILLATVVALAV